MASPVPMPDEIAVWGDELLERGDPLGHIIALARKHGEPDYEEDEEPHPELVAAQEAYEAASFPSCTTVSGWWRHGVLHHLYLWARLGAEAMEEVLRCPATRFLHRLDVSVKSEELADWKRLEATNPLPILRERGLPASVREARFDLRNVHSDFSQMYPCFSRLEALTLRAPQRIGAICLPALKSLSAHAFNAARFDELRSAMLPELELLDVNETRWQDLGRLTLPGAPTLDTLRLGRGIQPGVSYSPEEVNEYFRREVEGFFATPIATQVAHLELTDRQMDPLRERHLRIHARHFAAFETVRMARPESVELVATLERALGDRLIWT